MRFKARLIGIGWLLVLSLSFILSCGGGDDDPRFTITAQPTDQNVVVGTSATFTVSASNATGYQWQRSTDGGNTFTDLPELLHQVTSPRLQQLRIVARSFVSL